MSSWHERYSYNNDDGTLSSFRCVIGDEYTYTYDALKRLSSVSIAHGNDTDLTFNKNYTYVSQSADTTKTSTIPKKLTYTSGTDTWIDSSASYSAMGRVGMTIQTSDAETDQRIYSYDDRGQLTQETIGTLGQTYYYTYDTAGNMTSWKLYDHSKKAYIRSVEYGYANRDEWYDQVTTYNYEDVEYTGTGHISSYDSVNSGTKRFYWNDEGKLYRARVDGNIVNFEYDANGMRTSKNGTFEHEYYYEGTRLVMETVDDVKLIYLYDESGNVEAIRYNGASYYLIRNILGDVVQLRNAQNELIANYSYNAYGLPLSITNASGTEITNEAHIALINPIRYRGYYYDNETGLYYLESRYYDPELCRFISADALLIASPIGMNLYAYCGNDPVNFVDPHGNLPDERLLHNAQACANGTGAFYMLGCYHNHSHSFDHISEVEEISPLTEDQKVLVSTIAAEATVTVQGDPVSSLGRQAMANVALNRVGEREWSEYDTVSEICEFTGFDGYGDANYQACMNYLNNRDGSNDTYESIILDVMAAYESDITNGCKWYYTPATMTNASGVPNWNFSVFIEVTISGVDPYYEGRFYKYR